MKLDKINYIPVLNGSILNCALRDDMTIDNKRLTFYTNDGLMKYNKYLINPFHHAKIFEQIKKKELLLTDGAIFADSGGLQEITLNEKRYTPAEVFRWQQEHTHIGFSVDSLPFITPKDGTNRPGSFGGWKFDKTNFLKHAEKGKQNIDDTKKYRDKSKSFNFYGIIQGRGYTDYLNWYNILRDDSYLDGYCCKAPNVNPMTLAETCIFAINNLTKPVHFLGIGNISRAIVLYYASRYFKQPISYDSSSYDIGTQFRSYLLPFMFTRKLRFVSCHNLGEDSEICNKDDVIHISDASEICDCKACRTMKGDTARMIKENDPKLGSLISLHNLALQLKINKYVEYVVKNPVKLKEFVNFSFEPNLANKIMLAFDMIDLSQERGHEYALDKYKDNMQLNKSTGEQKGVFDF